MPASPRFQDSPVARVLWEVQEKLLTWSLSSCFGCCCDGKSHVLSSSLHLQAETRSLCIKIVNLKMCPGLESIPRLEPLMLFNFLFSVTSVVEHVFCSSVTPSPSLPQSQCVPRSTLRSPGKEEGAGGAGQEGSCGRVTSGGRRIEKDGPSFQLPALSLGFAPLWGLNLLSTFPFIPPRSVLPRVTHFY